MIKRFLFFAILSLFMLFKGQAQNNFYIANIYVSDSITHFPVSEATIFISQISKNAQTNKLGNCRFGLPPSSYFVIIDHPDYIPYQGFVAIFKDTLLNISLKPVIQSYMIKDVAVQASFYSKRTEVVSGLEKMNKLEIYKVPSISGEKDVVKALQLKPGVSGGSEGSAYLFVRGGTPDQNLYLLDGSTLYKSGHLFGFLSAINPVNIEKVDFYKGGFPAQYGGKLSSVVDVSTINPNLDSITGMVEMGTLTAKTLIHLPIVKGKLACSLAARSTVFDKFISAFNHNETMTNTGFYDVNGKLYFTPNSNTKLTLNAYLDNEYLYSMDNKIVVYDKDLLEWNNAFVGMQWHQKWTKHLYSELGGSVIKNNMVFEDVKKSSHIEQDFCNTFNSQFQEYPLLAKIGGTKGKWSYQLGTAYKYYKIHPSDLKLQGFDTTLFVENVPQSTYQTLGVFASGEVQVSDHFKIQGGLRKNQVWNTQSTWGNWEPRINFQTLFASTHTVKLSYAVMSQPLHQLTNFGLGLPIDVYLPFNEAFPPSQAYHYSIMYGKDIRISEHPFVFSMELYYKQMKGITAYKPGYSSVDLVRSSTGQPINPNDIITSGKGNSTGCEIMLEKPLGSINGAVSLTLSKTMQQFNGINGGMPFYANHHRPVVLSALLNYNFNPRHRLSFNFNYMSGGRFTIPSYFYTASNFEFSTNQVEIKNLNQYLMYTNDKVNDYKMKDFMTINLAYTISFVKRQLKSDLEFSLYNALNRNNPYYYYIDADKQVYNNASKIKLYAVSVFPIIPGIAYRLKF